MTTGTKSGNQGETQNNNTRSQDVRLTNIRAGKGIADIMKTSLGPKGMDKMIITDKGRLLITNDGATILDNLQVLHPTAKILVECSKAQDIEAGDGTTSVVVLAGALLHASEILINQGIHPSTISEGFSLALKKAIVILNEQAIPINLEDKAILEQVVMTTLSSKIISSTSANLANLAINAVMRLYKNGIKDINLNDVKVVKKLGGTIEDAELSDGLIFTDNKPSNRNNGPKKIVNPKVGLIQFCVSSPKTDIENNIKLGDYSQIDKILKEERKYIINLVKKIAESGVNVLLIQKSVLRDAVNDLSLHFLAKKGIMVIRDIERNDVEFICKTLNCKPISHIDQMKPERLGTALLANEVVLQDGSRIFRINNSPEDSISEKGNTSTILLRGSNVLVLDEAERSIHDALCVVRALVKNPKIVAGGGAIEIELSRNLDKYAQVIKGEESIVVRKFAESLEVIPFILAENCGLNSIKVITEIRNRHKNGEKECGLKGKTCEIVENTREEKILQPLTVNESALTLATETCKMILKIDDIVMSK